MNGTLVYEDYHSMYNNDEIKSLFFTKSQIHPSSIDLSLKIGGTLRSEVQFNTIPDRVSDFELGKDTAA